jgi:hypothetical protein
LVGICDCTCRSLSLSLLRRWNDSLLRRVQLLECTWPHRKRWKLSTRNTSIRSAYSLPYYSSEAALCLCYVINHKQQKCSCLSTEQFFTSKSPIGTP